MHAYTYVNTYIYIYIYIYIIYIYVYIYICGCIHIHIGFGFRVVLLQPSRAVVTGTPYCSRSKIIRLLWDTALDF